MDIEKVAARKKLILALDVLKIGNALALLEKLDGKVGMVKVNSLAAFFPEIIDVIQARRMPVWRDFKHHDVPKTVADFIAADLSLGLSMTTIHTLGGKKMMECAAEAAKGTPLKVLGVTILSSHTPQSFNAEIGISGSIQNKVIDLALMAERAGLAGVVCSPKEAKILRQVLNPETLIVTPGIAPEWAVKRKDRSRAATPRQAILNGADYIVVGDAIYGSKNPGEAADKIAAEIKEALIQKKEKREEIMKILKRQSAD